ncbi:NAD(P)-dependent oxidoreductase [Riemerella anatipestifer]|uniref:NAD-dependent epimerase/dehydratase family protein n=1 Tax=Riemerella anatipestifer TaxID=34085 RepID=UPI002A895687|nr:NAD(P)-dependent oxidoreductase [Riemerella anatipestifer]
MNILITGATGFLGRYLVRYLKEDKHQLFVLGRTKDKLKQYFDDSCTKKATNYSYEDLLEKTQGIDVVIHLASLLMQRDSDPLRVTPFLKNIEMTENLALASHANNVKHFINISSISVYGLCEGVSESDSTTPSNIYGVSKACSDIYLEYLQKKTQMVITTLRLARLYGIGEREGLMFTNFINKAKEKQLLSIFGDGKSDIEYLYIEDAVSAITKVINKPQKGIYNVGNTHKFSVKEMAEVINHVFENEGRIDYLEGSSAVYGTSMKNTKFMKSFNWEPEYSLLDAIKDIKKKQDE